jgi:hypothetical protein
MQPLDVLSTTGRALFFRFLIDRRIVLEDELSEILPNARDIRDAFSTVDNAAGTSAWLDETFNGDLLPLVEGLSPESSYAERVRAYRQFYRDAGAATGQKLFNHLEAILRGWKNVGGSHYQLSFDVDWDDFNFAHIPIGVLSQVYETFSRQWDEEHAGEMGVYYTPRHLARLMVEEAFAGLKEPQSATVLDPACGAGVFLVLAFRQLVRESWLQTGNRPDNRRIQKILYKQLRGFEVSESALRLTALALYISAIEVNSTQRPPASLKFPRPLRNEVLFNFGRHESEQRRKFVLGSLAPEVPKTFDNAFDVVVTNPPWTRLRASSQGDKEKNKERLYASQMNAEFTEVTRRALESRGLGDIASAYRNPDNNPDLPFLWRASEWAKKDGVIAMALPGRIILKQSDKGKAARNAIMRGLVITGILNGSDLEKTPVWPNMDLPFLLLFARNAIPPIDHRFVFATPIRENRLSSRGQFRLDHQAAETVAARDVIEKPWLLKALAVGTVLDIEIIEKLPANSLGDFWQRNGLYSGLGYNLSTNLKQEPADHLCNLLDFEKPQDGFSIQYDELHVWREKHNRRKAHAPRSKDLYAAPVVIVPKALHDSREHPKAFISQRQAIAFSQSNYGFSAASASDGKLLTAALFLAVHSSLYQHFCLMKSSSHGASFRIFLKEDLEAFPFPDPRKLSSSQKQELLGLVESLQKDANKPWKQIDDFMFALYGLDKDDAEVVRDTVAFHGPYRSLRDNAERPVSIEEMEEFRQYLQGMLRPLFDITQQTITVEIREIGVDHLIPSWQFFSILLAGDSLGQIHKLLGRLMVEANITAASRIVLRVPGGGLIIGILNQRRFWTRSRARLCSLHIEQYHLDAFPLVTP